MTYSRFASIVMYGFVSAALLTACGGDGGTTAVCGNGQLDPGEACDDGNAVSGDGCNATCTSEEFCGNGIVDGAVGEQCEDGNSLDGDGCSSTCETEIPARCGDGTVDADEQCDDGNTNAGDGCGVSCREESCGNGILDPDEVCEDGNTSGGDGCSADCQPELGGAICGDGTLDTGEQCDDGNTDTGDGCSHLCLFEICGNSILDAGEQCEDGNTVAGDGCSPTCQIEQAGTCGDGVLDAAEQCDDGNTMAGDGCSALCRFEGCGNGILDPGEQCEDGNTMDGDGCSAGCAIENLASCGNANVDAGEQCDDGNFFPGDGCSPFCTDEVCGNGILDPGEECEDGNTDNGDGCSAVCSAEVAGACGDGVMSGGEQCDDGNAMGGDGCSPFCTVEACGNGILDVGEVCEDGNTTSGDGCADDCQSAEVCGNGIMDANEGCDDGNTNNGDGCNAVCQNENSACGDGTVDPSEGCDDGNNVDGDGCSAICTLETCGNGVIDPGEGCDDGNADNTDNCPSTCRPAACGDSFVHALSEQCDDANLNSGDGCSSTCRLEFCGNNALDPGETCDDGNMDDTDSCPSTCQPAACGDGFVHAGFETCDDGNTTGGDGCAATCNSDETCGNGIIDAGEVCDDGNAIDTDACPNTCQPAFCGDGFIYLGFEGCDDGNNIDGDGCSALCIPDGCGSGTVDGGEECDEGGANGTGGASCFDNCVAITLAFTTMDELVLDTSIRGDGPRALATGDVNGDGVLDLTTANGDAGYASVLYGFGDGRFWAPWYRPVGNNPTHVELADVNGDGMADAVTVNRNGASISVALGDGDRFLSSSNYTVVFGSGASDPRDLAVADLDGDTDLDVVTANAGSDNITILRNNGAGEFSPIAVLTTLLATSGDRPESVEVADVTGDGVVDIVTANASSDDVTVFAGLGGGAYAGAQTYTNRAGANGDGPTDLALADMTGDGLADAVTVNSISDDICVLVADGVGGLNAPVCFTTLTMSGGDAPARLDVADVDGDLELDVLVTCHSDDVVLLSGIAGGAAFQAPISFNVRVGTSGDRPYGIEVGDINADMIPDIITTNITSSDIAILLGQGGGVFATPLVFEAQYGYDGTDPRSPRLHDVNSDGALDVVFVSDDDSDIVVVPGFGDGRLAPSQTVFIGDNPQSIAVADFNMDGKPDVVTLDTSSGQIEQLMQRDSGDFVRSSINTGYQLANLAVGNLDDDADIDVVALADGNRYLIPFTNDGAGTLSVFTYLNLSETTPRVLSLADVTGDNRLDAITVSPLDDQVFIRPGNGMASFGGATSLSTRVSTQGDNPYWVTAGEFTDDAINDIATANYNTNDVTVFTGISGGAFSAPIIVAAAFGPTQVGVRNVQYGDFNGDGIPDLATANEIDDSVSVMLGFGGGAFSAPQLYPVGDQPYALIVEDLDGDGLDDIATVNYNAASVSVLLSQGHP